MPRWASRAFSNFETSSGRSSLLLVPSLRWRRRPGGQTPCSATAHGGEPPLLPLLVFHSMCRRLGAGRNILFVRLVSALYITLPTAAFLPPAHSPLRSPHRHLALPRRLLASAATMQVGGGNNGGVDVAKVRADTRGCAGGEKDGVSPLGVHFNNAGASLMPSVVVDTQKAIVEQEETEGGYETAAARLAEMEALYGAVGSLINCREEEVAFVESATRGWTLAFHSLKLAAGDRLITTACDYGSNFVAYLQAKERLGIEIVIVPDDDKGQVDMQQLQKEASHPRSRVICLCHVPTGGGLVNPAVEVGKVAKERGLVYLLDACQSVGHLKIDVDEIGCDMLVAAGRKYLRGPRGTGILYVRKSLLSQMDICVLDQYGAPLASEGAYDMRSDARVFEMWEFSTAGKAGLARAVEYCLGVGISNIEDRIKALAQRARAGLGGVGGVTVTDSGRELCGIVTFVVHGVDSLDVKQLLGDRGIRVSYSPAAGGSRVWFDRRGLTGVVRASVHYYNTEQEVDAFVGAVKEIAGSIK